MTLKVQLKGFFLSDTLYRVSISLNLLLLYKANLIWKNIHANLQIGTAYTICNILWYFKCRNFCSWPIL